MRVGFVLGFWEWVFVWKMGVVLGVGFGENHQHSLSKWGVYSSSHLEHPEGVLDVKWPS